MMNLTHNVYMHQRTIIVTVETLDMPRVPIAERVTTSQFAPGLWSVTVQYGFDDQLDVPLALRECAEHGLIVDPLQVSYFVGRETIHVAPGPRLARRQKQVFATLHHEEPSPADFYRLPPDRGFEVGSQVVI